jgi:hypothetical protein
LVSQKQAAEQAFAIFDTIMDCLSFIGSVVTMAGTPMNMKDSGKAGGDLSKAGKQIGQDVKTLMNPPVKIDIVLVLENTTAEGVESAWDSVSLALAPGYPAAAG